VPGREKIKRFIQWIENVGLRHVLHAVAQQVVGRSLQNPTDETVISSSLWERIPLLLWMRVEIQEQSGIELETDFKDSGDFGRGRNKT
jgi:hypothetical protein